jgi:hypothetical protein
VLDFCVDATPGNHLLELYGAEDCCDATTKWSFSVNDGEWQDFTTDNLNNYKKLPDIEGDTIIEFGTVSVDQPDAKQWQTVAITGKFSQPVVVLGVPSANGARPITVRVVDVTRE